MDVCMVWKLKKVNVLRKGTKRRSKTEEYFLAFPRKAKISASGGNVDVQTFWAYCKVSKITREWCFELQLGTKGFGI